MSKPTSANGSESGFEFVETPKAPTPAFEKFEDCGVRTTPVSGGRVLVVVVVAVVAETDRDGRRRRTDERTDGRR